MLTEEEKCECRATKSDLFLLLYLFYLSRLSKKRRVRVEGISGGEEGRGRGVERDGRARMTEV